MEGVTWVSDADFRTHPGTEAATRNGLGAEMSIRQRSSSVFPQLLFQSGSPTENVARETIRFSFFDSLCNDPYVPENTTARSYPSHHVVQCESHDPRPIAWPEFRTVRNLWLLLFLLYSDNARRLSLRSHEQNEPSLPSQVPTTPPSMLRLKRRRALSQRDSTPAKVSKKDDQNTYEAHVSPRRVAIS